MQIKMQSSRKEDETAKNETAKDSDAFAFEPSFRRRCSRAKKEYVSSNSATARVILLIISSPRDPIQMENKICKNMERNKHAFGNCKCSAAAKME